MSIRRSVDTLSSNPASSASRFERHFPLFHHFQKPPPKQFFLSHQYLSSHVAHGLYFTQCDIFIGLYR
jgi:hypothetical protein